MTTKSIIKVIDNKLVEKEKLEFTVTENGKTQEGIDVPKKLIKQIEKFHETEIKESAENNNNKNEKYWFMPFIKKNRTKYNFQRQDDTVVDDQRKRVFGL